MTMAKPTQRTNSGKFRQPRLKALIFADLTTSDKFGQHFDRWKDCTACKLCESRRRIVITPRGQMPADVMFVGEAPGRSEDMMGLPFVGEAGKLLDDIIDQVQDERGPFRYLITNIVACLPPVDGSDKLVDPCPHCGSSGRLPTITKRTPRIGHSNLHGTKQCRHCIGTGYLPRKRLGTGGPVRAPKATEAKACSARLVELYRLARPRVIVTLGATAKKYLPALIGPDSIPETAVTVVDVIHPSAILRKQEKKDPAAVLDMKRTILRIGDAVERL